MKPIPEGTTDQLVIETTSEMGARHLPVPMYSTPAMVGHIEQLCLTMMVPYLEPGENSVGYRVDVKHTAPTPLGMKVTISAKCIECGDRKAIFEIEAHNQTGARIGEGKHERRAVAMTRFTGAPS